MNKLKQQEKTMLEKAPALLTLTVGICLSVRAITVSAREDLISITRYSHNLIKKSHFN